MTILYGLGFCATLNTGSSLSLCPPTDSTLKYCMSAVKNLNRDILARASPRHRRLPSPKGMTCG